MTVAAWFALGLVVGYFYRQWTLSPQPVGPTPRHNLIGEDECRQAAERLKALDPCRDMRLALEAERAERKAAVLQYQRVLAAVIESAPDRQVRVPQVAFDIQDYRPALHESVDLATGDHIYTVIQT